MFRSLALFATVLAILSNCLPVAAQSITKKIHVTVKDLATGNTIAGAEVTYKGFFGKMVTGKTDAAGQVTLQVPLISRSATGTLRSVSN